MSFVWEKVDGKIVQPDNKEAVFTQAEHRIKMAVQRDADERWRNHMDKEDKITTNTIEVLRSDVVTLWAKLSEEVVCMESRHHGSAASTVAPREAAGARWTLQPVWCCGHRACGSRAARARWLHQGVQNRGSVRELDGILQECGATFYPLEKWGKHTHNNLQRERARAVRARAVHSRLLEQVSHEALMWLGSTRVCCTARACVVENVRHVDVGLHGHFSGRVGGSRRCSSFSPWLRAFALVFVRARPGARDNPRVAAERNFHSRELSLLVSVVEDRAPFETPDKNCESQLDTVVWILEEMYANVADDLGDSSDNGGQRQRQHESLAASKQTTIKKQNWYCADENASIVVQAESSRTNKSWSVAC